jgi:hypothetical protein
MDPQASTGELRVHSRHFSVHIRGISGYRRRHNGSHMVEFRNVVAALREWEDYD